MVAAGLLLNVARRAVTAPRAAARKPVAIGHQAARSLTVSAPPMSDRRFAGVRGRHRWRHVGARAAGDRGRRGARRSRPRPVRRSTTSAPSAGSRRGCCPTRRSRTRSSTSSGFQRARHVDATSASLPKLWRARREAIDLLRDAPPASRRQRRRLRQHAGGARRRVRSTSRSWSSATTGSRVGPARSRPGGPRPAPWRSPTRDCRAPTVTGAPVRQAVLDVDRSARSTSRRAAELGCPTTASSSP